MNSFGYQLKRTLVIALACVAALVIACGYFALTSKPNSELLLLILESGLVFLSSAYTVATFIARPIGGEALRAKLRDEGAVQMMVMNGLFAAFLALVIANGELEPTAPRLLVLLYAVISAARSWRIWRGVSTASSPG